MSSGSLDILIGKIVSKLENESILLSGVHDEINEIKLELSSMRCFLEDADSKGVVTRTENAWISSVRDLACEVESVIDEYLYHLNEQHQWRDETKSFFLKGNQFLQNLWFKRNVAVKLQDINRRIRSIPERNQRYGQYQLEGKYVNKRKRMPKNYDPNWLRNHNESALFLKEDDLVGIKSTQKQLLEWLINDEPQRSVISVVGMGGLGKTTLVANTFNKLNVKQHFHCSAWVTVSQQYAVEELFKSMIKELINKANEGTPLELNNMDYRDLVGTLVNFLQTKRYLVVLDDVWSVKLWQEICIALPTNKSGSRILLTTRNQDIAASEFGVVNHVLPLKFLSVEDSWTLFCMKAFASNAGQCQPYLHSLATNLVAKCEGLPLAIVALGGLMASKKSIAEWKRIFENLRGELRGNDKLETLEYISLLSYHDLPSPLKLCFLYCCIFPEDHPIKRKRLIRLWMAEGFVESSQDITLADVAERYLMELTCRGLLQVIESNGSGRPKKCKMHDILRELAISISKVEKFVAKSDGKEEVEDNGLISRLSVEAKEAEMKVGKGISKLHSLFIFAVSDISRSSFNMLPSGLKLLRVLDLENAPIEDVSDELVNLFNLRYLNLSSTQVKQLPEDIGRLHNLQYLILKRTKIKELPQGIVKLKNLLYLVAYDRNTTTFEFHYDWSTTVPSNICSLKNLEVLSFVEARGTFIKQLSVMTQLRRLSIANVREADEKNLCLAIGQMRLLRFLLVMSCNEDEQLKMDALESPPPYLEKLILVGKMEKVPHWFSSLHSLTNLQFRWSRLREDFLAHIQALPNLGQLLLSNAYEGGQLNFHEGFQKLKFLWIKNSPRLKGIVVNEGVMPGLQEISIYECNEFVTLPHGWKRLPHLKRVYLGYVSSELMEQIRGPQNQFETAEITRNLEDDESQTNWVVRPWRTRCSTRLRPKS